MNDFVFIHLCHEIDVDDDFAIFDARADLLIEHPDNAGGVRPDLIARDIQIPDFSYTFQIRRDLLECIAFGDLSGQPSGIDSRVMVTHTIFGVGGHDAKHGLQRLNGL